MPDVYMRCGICGKGMGWLRNVTRWQRFLIWVNGGSRCSDDCWAEGAH